RPDQLGNTMSTAQQMLEITDHLQALTVTNRHVVVVTGATGGIGEAIVKNLAPDYAVVAQGRGSRKLAKLSVLGQQVYPVRYDLSDGAAFAQTFGRLPKVDSLIHAAAIVPRYAYDDSSAAAWSEALHRNITVFAVLKRCVLH